MVLLDLVPVLGFAYVTELRSRARRGRRFDAKGRSPRGPQLPSHGLVGVVMVVGILALLIAPHDPMSSVAYANWTAVLVVMVLIPIVGGLLHNRTRARR